MEANKPQVEKARMIHVRLDIVLHKHLKMKVAAEGKTIQNYVTELIGSALRKSKTIHIR